MGTAKLRFEMVFNFTFLDSAIGIDFVLVDHFI